MNIEYMNKYTNFIKPIIVNYRHHKVGKCKYAVKELFFYQFMEINNLVVILFVFFVKVFQGKDM